MQEREELPLQLAEGGPRPAAEDLLELPGALRVGPPRQGLCDRVRIHHPSHLRLVGDTREVVERHRAGEVEEGSCRGRDRDAATVGAVAFVYPLHAMRQDSRDAAIGGCGHLGGRRSALSQPEQKGGCPAAEHRGGAAREHRRHVARIRARRPMPDPVDPAQLVMEHPFGDAAADRLAAQSRIQKLRNRHHTVLASGDPGDLALRWWDFGPHTGPKSDQRPGYAAPAMARAGIEPATPRFSVVCSTD